MAPLSLPVTRLQRQRQPLLCLVDSSDFPPNGQTVPRLLRRPLRRHQRLVVGCSVPRNIWNIEPVPQTTGSFSFGGTGGAAGGGLFGTTTANKDAVKSEEKKDPTPAATTSLFGFPKDNKKNAAPLPVPRRQPVAQR